MYEGRHYPGYLGSTPIKMEVKHPYAVIEPNSGQQITPDQFDSILSPRQRMAVTKFKDIISGCRTYGQLIDRLANVTEKVSDVYSALQHHIIEGETGDFSVGIMVTIKPSPMDYEICLATTVEVVWDMKLFEIAYDDEDVIEVDSYTSIAASATNAMSLLSRGSDYRLPQVQKVLGSYWDILQSINEYRWSGIKCELLAGIPPLIIMRRWGVLSVDGIIENGIDENKIFAELAEKYGRK